MRRRGRVQHWKASFQFAVTDVAQPACAPTGGSGGEPAEFPAQFGQRGEKTRFTGRDRDDCHVLGIFSRPKLDGIRPALLWLEIAMTNTFRSPFFPAFLPSRTLHVRRSPSS